MRMMIAPDDPALSSTNTPTTYRSISSEAEVDAAGETSEMAIGRLSISSASQLPKNSLRSSTHSNSKSSSRTGLASKRKIHRRRDHHRHGSNHNYKPNEKTWLRDTLSLNSSDHSRGRFSASNTSLSLHSMDRSRRWDDSKHSISSVASQRQPSRLTALREFPSQKSLRVEKTTIKELHQHRDEVGKPILLPPESYHDVPLKSITVDVPAPAPVNCTRVPPSEWAAHQADSQTRHQALLRPRGQRVVSQRSLSPSPPLKECHRETLPEKGVPVNRPILLPGAHRVSSRNFHKRSTSLRDEFTFPEDAHLRRRHAQVVVNASDIPRAVLPRPRDPSNLRPVKQNPLRAKKEDTKYRSIVPTLPLPAELLKGPNGPVNSPADGQRVSNNRPAPGSQADRRADPNSCGYYERRSSYDLSRNHVQYRRDCRVNREGDRGSPPIHHRLGDYGAAAGCSHHNRNRHSNERNHPRDHQPSPPHVISPGMKRAYSEDARRTADQQRRENQRQDQQNEPVLVNVGPGPPVRLRRAKETVEAVAADFYQSIVCIGCSKDIFCIADVSLVVCPSCRTIGPVDGDYFEGREIKRTGLGLGFSCETLFAIQREILAKRARQCSGSPRGGDLATELKGFEEEYFKRTA